MVRLWAEKEMRNLKRLVSAGIRCPEPVEVRENILVMSFLGDEEGWASPRLKDAQLPGDIEALSNLYAELVCIVRRMYHHCKLVHADLSEYNVLLHDGHPYVIDVSQSVEHDHPSAFDFLRSDLHNIEEFFGARGVKCLGLRKSFEFVTKEDLGIQNELTGEQSLIQWCKDMTQPGGLPGGLIGENKEEMNGLDVNTIGLASRGDVEGHAAHEDAVFLHSFIPRTLNEVCDPERDIGKLIQGDGDGLIYAKTIGVVDPSVQNNISPPRNGIDLDEVDHDGKSKGERSADKHIIHATRDEDDSESGKGSEESEEEEEGKGTDGGAFQERKPRGHRHEDREAKKERKKAVKAEARERRKHKMPKAEKKKVIRKAKA